MYVNAERARRVREIRVRRYGENEIDAVAHALNLPPTNVAQLRAGRSHARSCHSGVLGANWRSPALAADRRGRAPIGQNLRLALCGFR
jgi:hypothetical protein